MIKSADSISSLPPALRSALSDQPIGSTQARLVDPGSWRRFGHRLYRYINGVGIYTFETSTQAQFLNVPGTDAHSSELPCRKPALLLSLP